MIPTTKARYDAEEARKELLATLHASRELGPEMDETLADRYIERLTALRPAGSFDPAKAHADLQSLLASARGSDPAGDDALVESFLTNLLPPPPGVPAYGAYGPYGAYPPAPGSMEYGPLVRVRQGGLGRAAPLLVMVAIFVIGMSLTQGHAVWLILPLLFLFGSGQRNRSRRMHRDQRRAERYDHILQRDDPRLPPSGPPEIL